MLFAQLKRILNLGRLRLRGPNGARDEFHLAATAQNLRKLAKLIPMPTPALACGSDVRTLDPPLRTSPAATDRLLQRNRPKSALGRAFHGDIIASGSSGRTRARSSDAAARMPSAVAGAAVPPARLGRICEAGGVDLAGYAPDGRKPDGRCVGRLREAAVEGAAGGHAIASTPFGQAR